MDALDLNRLRLVHAQKETTDNGKDKPFMSLMRSKTTLESNFVGCVVVGGKRGFVVKSTGRGLMYW